MGMGSGYYGSGYNLPSPQQFANYLNSAGYVQPSKEPSMIDKMVARANQASSNLPSLAALFPYINTGYQQYVPNVGTIPTTGLLGAGRFLGQAPTMGTSTAPAIAFDFSVPGKKA